jgi:hypothetical protein
MEPVLEIIDSYETRIASVEELMTTAYQTTVNSGDSFAILDEERERLETGLQQTLAKNCSLRKKDFERLLERLLSEANTNRAKIDEERNLVRVKVKEYLDEQKQLAKSLRLHLIGLVQEKTSNNSLDTIIGNIKSCYEDKCQRLFSILRDFQTRLETFQKEQSEINSKLKRLTERGELLSLEDLRELEANRASQDRKVKRELRREEWTGCSPTLNSSVWKRAISHQ